MQDSLIRVNTDYKYVTNPGEYAVIVSKNIILMHDTYGKKYVLQFETSQDLNKAFECLKEAGYKKGIFKTSEKFYTIEKNQ